MGSCRIPCEGATNVACGAQNGPVVYSTGGGGVFPSYVATILATPYPTYNCAVGAGGGKLSEGPPHFSQRV